MYLRILIFSLLASVLIVGTIQAQPKPQKLRMLKDILELNEKQAQTIETIMDSTENKLDRLKEKIEAGRKQNMEQMKSILNNEDKEIVKNLNDDQKKKYAGMKEEREDHRPSRRERPGPPPPDEDHEHPMEGPQDFQID